MYKEVVPQSSMGLAVEVVGYYYGVVTNVGTSVVAQEFKLTIRDMGNGGAIVAQTTLSSIFATSSVTAQIQAGNFDASLSWYGYQGTSYAIGVEVINAVIPYYSIDTCILDAHSAPANQGISWSSMTVWAGI